MKQVLQSLLDGTSSLEELPVPQVGKNSLAIRTACSLLSAGTERMLVEFGKANFIDKARQQPDKVKQTLDKVKTDGVIATYESVKSKLGYPLPLGYSNVGVVVAVGDNVTGYQIGDRVVSNGPHAEIVVVPANLCCKIPERVSDEAAVFAIVSSIGLQGIRLAAPTFGETVLVSGLGLIGLITAQLLVANGCRVLGIDPDPNKCSLAETFGISSFCLDKGSNPVEWCLQCTNGIGLDAVLVTAATSSSDPIHVAAESCRQRGRIVLVGVTGLELRRDLFYEKELTFQVSCSYGPGRYDPKYELEGNDYPLGFVRWTEQRNFQAVLNAIAGGLLQTKQLISHQFDLNQVEQAYELLGSSNPSLGILLRYPATANHSLDVVECPIPNRISSVDFPSLSVIGAGNYACRTLIPAFAKTNARFQTLSASSGVGPVYLGRKFGFRQASTNTAETLKETTSNAVVIVTRHDSHASLVKQALASGKHVFVEKPLCLTSSELSSIESAYNGKTLLMVGFNRRFSPLICDLKKQLSRLQGPKAFVYTCNAGAIPSDHWSQDEALGGGRLLGEACHFVDLLRHLADSPIEYIYLLSADDSKSCPDTFSIQLKFTDGSIGTVHYFSNGNKVFPKERLEVFVGGKVFCMDNYRKLTAYGIPGFRTRRLLSQNKGQEACCAAFINSIKTGGIPPIPVAELFEVQRLLLNVANK